MGMYGEVEIIATFENQEKAENVFDNLNDKVTEFIKEKLGDESFSFDITFCDLEDTEIIAKICSDRYQNAEWRTNQLFEYLRTQCGLVEFTADAVVPDNIIFWNAEDED